MLVQGIVNRPPKIASFLLVFFVVAFFFSISTGSDSDYGVILPSKCETCKILAKELETRFLETGKTSDVLHTSYSFDEKQTESSKNPAKKYKDSELRLIETLDGACDRILQYSMHKEHANSKRFAKGQSETMKTLHGLVNKGVKVELGIPFELWDAPSVEISTMKRDCEQILEDFESEVESWYFKDESSRPRLQTYLCENMVLKTPLEKSCLHDDLPDKKPDKSNNKKKRDDL